MRHSKAIVFRQRVFRQRAPKSIAFCKGHCYRVFDRVRSRLKSLTFGVSENETGTMNGSNRCVIANALSLIY